MNIWSCLRDKVIKNKFMANSKEAKARIEYISNIENGRMNPTLSTIERIAKALDISVDELLK